METSDERTIWIIYMFRIQNVTMQSVLLVIINLVDLSVSK